MSILKRSLISEDWLSLWIGLFVFVPSWGLFADIDVLGWSIKTNVWTKIFNSTDLGLIESATASANETNTFRVMFFAFTFSTIGVVFNFNKLKEEAVGKLAVVYLLYLFGFIICLRLINSWIFFNGITPPIIS